MRISPRQLVLFLAAALCSPPAFSEDFLTSGASARAAAAGGVFLPGKDSALDAMAMNPAGLALISGARVDLSAAAMFARGSFVSRANTDGRLNANGIVPYGAFAMPLGKTRCTLGFAALPELMSAARWRYVDTPGGADNVSYGLLDHRSEILAVRAAAGFGMYLNSRVQVGMTVGATYNSNKLQTAYIFQNHPALAGLKTLLDLRTNGVGWNISSGVLAQVSHTVRIGGAYRSRTTIASRGLATGNAGVQFAAIALGAARPDFRYDARVDNILPQSAMTNVDWQLEPRTRIAAQVEWVNWKRAFVDLPVTLTHGNNSDINGLLGTDGIRDSIPLKWKDQVVARLGFERSLRESTTVRAGYARWTDPVPGSTLSPLTAAITRSTVSAGIGQSFGRWRIDAAYRLDPAAVQKVGRSALKAGEYGNSSVRVGTQGLIVTTSIRL